MSLLFCGLLLLGASPPVAAEGPEFVVREIGEVDEYSYYATDINEAGQVAGRYSTQDFSPEGYRVNRSFIWLPSPAYGLPAGVSDLGTLRTHPLGSSWSYAISDNGQIVGTSEIDILSEWKEPYLAAFSWQDGHLTEVAFPGDRPPYNSGNAVNADGQIAATMGTGFSCETYIWLPEPAYGMEAGAHWLPTLPGLSESLVAGINAHGQVAGTSRQTCDVAGGPDAAFLWLPEPAYGLPAGIHDLTSNLPDTGEIPDAWDVEVYDLNDQGMVVGVVSELTESYGVLWDAGAGTETILPFVPAGINEHGWMVGRSDSNEAVLWRDGQMTLLNDLIPADSGWDVRGVRGINDRGQMIGYGVKDGQSGALLLDLASVFTDGFESGSTGAWSSGP